MYVVLTSYDISLSIQTLQTYGPRDWCIESVLVRIGLGRVGLLMFLIIILVADGTKLPENLLIVSSNELRDMSASVIRDLFFW